MRRTALHVASLVVSLTCAFGTSFRHERINDSILKIYLGSKFTPSMHLFNIFLICISLNGAILKTESAFRETKNLIQLIIFSEKDTFALGDKMIIDAAIHNKTNKTIEVPNTFSLTSNLYPNGVSSDSISSGGIFNLKISPVSKWPDIFIEDLAVMKNMGYTKIYPDSSANFRIDIGSHINSYNKQIKDSTAQIKPGHYTLQLTYVNAQNDSNSKNMFKGRLESNAIKVFIK